MSAPSAAPSVAPAASEASLSGISYGSVRAALGLGAGPPEMQVKPEAEGGAELQWSRPEKDVDSAAFFAALDVQPKDESVKREERPEHSIETLRAELVTESRRAYREQVERKKNCPLRKQAEDRITAAWAQSAPVPEETPQQSAPNEPLLPHRTPDPLHSPFPRFPPNF